jgi:hypothetical protein
MPECVAADRLRYPCCQYREAYASLQHRFVEMVPSSLVCLGMDVRARCRKYPLPAPFPSGVRILATKCARNST